MLGELSIKPVVTIGPDASTQAAARLMRTKKVGAPGSPRRREDPQQCRGAAPSVVSHAGTMKGIPALDDVLMWAGPAIAPAPDRQHTRCSSRLNARSASSRLAAH